MTVDAKNVSENSLYSTIQQEYKIMAEYKMVQSENIGGVYVIPSYESAFVWYGVIFVRLGPYTNGIFRFNISLPNNFPNNTEAPTIIFQSTICHPLICPYTGTVDISEAFPQWKSTENHIWELLKFVQFIFENVTVCVSGSNNANKDAVDLMQKNKNEFLAKVRECVAESRIRIYDAPPTEDRHYLTFEQFDADVHGATLDTIKSQLDISISPPTSGASLLFS